MAFCSLALPAQTISVAQLGEPLAHEYKNMSDQPEKTLLQFWGAAALNPKSAAARVNVGFTLLSLNRLQQAEWAARESLEIDPSNPRAQLLLGWTLTRQYHYTAEALDYMHRAAHTYPEAYLGAADLLAHQGAIADARAEVESYLATGAGEHRKTAQNWLKILTLN